MEQNTVKKKGPEISQRIKNFFKNWWAKVRAMSGKDWLNFFLNNAIYFIIIIFVIAVTIYIEATKASGSPGFLSASNFGNIVQRMSYSMFLALGVGGIIVLTGTDLSAGRIMGFTACLAAALFQKSGYSGKIFTGMGPWTNAGIIGILGAVIVLVIIGGGMGAANGFFVAKFKLHPFIVTLATQLILFGMVMIFTGFGKGAGGQVPEITPAYIKVAKGNMIVLDDFIIQIYTVYAILAIVLTWFMWNKTTFGKNMYAVGSNPEAAKVSGINVNKTIILVFMYAGIMYAIAGFIYGGNLLAVPGNSTGVNAELDAIAACVIGGVSFTGGVGKIRGIVVGVLLLVLINIGLFGLKLEASYQYIVKGALILFAVAVDMRKYLTKR